MKPAVNILIAAIFFLSCEANAPVDPYSAVKPPFTFVEKETETGDEYFFGGKKKPALRISDGLLHQDSANIVLDSIGLPPVTEPGRNIEKFWFEGARVGAGRLYRSHYRWDDYDGEPLTFIREAYGCDWPGKQYGYNCLKKIIVGPTLFDERYQN